MEDLGHRLQGVLNLRYGGAMMFKHAGPDVELTTSDAGPDEDYLGLIGIAFLFGDIDMGQVKLALTWLELESATPSADRRSH